MPVYYNEDTTGQPLGNQKLVKGINAGWVRQTDSTNKAKSKRSITFILVYEDVPVYQHTLLIAPQSYRQTEPSRSTVVQTMGGGFIDDFGLGFRQVTIGGTTGFATRFIETNKVTNGGVLAMDGYQAFKDLRDNIYRFYFDDVPPSTGWSVQEDRANQAARGLMNTLLGFTNLANVVGGGGANQQAYLGQPQNKDVHYQRPKSLDAFVKKQNMTGSVDRSKLQLRMFYWGNEDYFLVHPTAFEFNQSADSPVLYNYTIQLIVLRDLNGQELKAQAEAGKDDDVLKNLTDAGHRSRLIGKQLDQTMLRYIVNNYYNKVPNNPHTAVVNSELTYEAATWNTIMSIPGFFQSLNQSIGQKVDKKDLIPKASVNRAVTLMSGEHRKVVLNMSMNEAEAADIDTTENEVGAIYDDIDSQNLVSNATPTIFSGSTGTAPAQNDIGLLGRMNDKLGLAMSQVMGVRDSISGRINAPGGPGDAITMVKNATGMLNEITGTILNFHYEKIIPPEVFGMLRDIREIQCDLAAVNRFPEMFLDSLDNAVNRFRDLLQNSGCAQTL